MNTDDLLTSTELATAAGVTFRQIDYWTRTGAIEATTDPGPGKGHRRRYHPNLVAPLRTVAALHRALAAGIPTGLIAGIVDHHPDGWIDLDAGAGLRLSWRASRPLEWDGPRYLTDAECDRALEALEQLGLEP